MSDMGAKLRPLLEGTFHIPLKYTVGIPKRFEILFPYHKTLMRLHFWYGWDLDKFLEQRRRLENCLMLNYMRVLSKNTLDYTIFIQTYAFNKELFDAHQWMMQRNKVVIESYLARRSLQETCNDSQVLLNQISL